MESLVGKGFGAYQIVAQVGRGGTAAVHTAYHHTLDDTSRLKFCPRNSLEFCGRIQATEPNIWVAHIRADQALVTVNVTKEW